MTRRRTTRSPQRILARPHSAEEWDRARAAIADLYINQGLPLNKVQSRMEEIGFLASKRQYKTRLSRWELGKNITREDWLFYVRMRDKRQSSGKPFSRLEIHRKIKNDKDFRDYLKLQKVSEEDFVREALASSPMTPSYIRYADSPSPVEETALLQKSTHQQNARSAPFPLASGYQESLPTDPNHTSGTMPRDNPGTGEAVSNISQNTIGSSNAQHAQVTRSFSGSFRENGHDGALADREQQSFRTAEFQSAATDDNPGSHGLVNPEWTNSAACETSLPNYMSQAIEPRSGVMPVGIPYSQFGRMLAQIQSPGHQETIVDETYDVQGRSIAFIVDTMMACISATSAELSTCGQWLEQTLHGLRRMLSDRLLLVTLSTVLVWLQVHDQGSIDGSLTISEALMREFSRVTIDSLGPDACACLILEWMTAMLGKRLPTCRITSDMLEQVWIQYQNVLGRRHPNTIVALYCFSFHIMKVDQSYSKAENYLRWAHEVAVEELGSSHLCSLSILSTLSRAQSRQGNFEGALQTIRRCVEEEPHGQNHPHRLSLLLRLAILCGRQGLLEEREQLYWLVVEGRAATLGPDHVSTRKAHASLVTILQEAGKWEAHRERVENILVNPQVSVSEYENWWHRTVKLGGYERSREWRETSEETE